MNQLDTVSSASSRSSYNDKFYKEAVMHGDDILDGSNATVWQTLAVYIFEAFGVC